MTTLRQFEQIANEREAENPSKIADSICLRYSKYVKPGNRDKSQKNAYLALWEIDTDKKVADDDKATIQGILDNPDSVYLPQYDFLKQLCAAGGGVEQININLHEGIQKRVDDSIV